MIICLYIAWELRIIASERQIFFLTVEHLSYAHVQVLVLLMHDITRDMSRVFLCHSYALL